MVLALATDWMALFPVAGPVQAAALLLFLGIIAPPVSRLSGGSRVAIVLAALFLAFGLPLAQAIAAVGPLAFAAQVAGTFARAPTRPAAASLPAGS